MSLDELSGSEESLVGAMTERVRAVPPRLGGLERASVADGDWRPSPNPSIRIGTKRHYVAIQIEGDPALLGYWPDEADQAGLVPVDEFSLESSSTGHSDSVAQEYQEALLEHAARRSFNLWFTELRSEGKEQALYTSVDLTPEEERDTLREEFNPRELIDRQRDQIEPIVAAVAEQTAAFFRP